VDYYSFTVTQANSKVEISLASLPSLLNYDFDIRTADGTLVSQPLATASSETTQTAAGRKYYRKIMNAGTYYIRVFARTGYGNRAYEVDLNISLSNTLHVLSVPSIAQKKDQWCLHIPVTCGH
jgi:hypothetical protein